MTKKLSNAQAKGYQLWYEFSVMRRLSIDFQYSCTYVISDNFLIPLMKDGYFTFWVFLSLKNLWKRGTILLMGLKFKGCTQKPVTFMDLLLSCHTHTGAQKHSQVSSINTYKCSECPNIDTRQRLNIVHFCYLCMHHLVVPKYTQFNNIWLSFKIF